MKLAELIITEARERGLRHFFGLPGGGSPLDMMEAGRQLDVSFVSVAHESSAAIMAAYYGLMKNTAGLALSVKGIGAGNLAGGAANAYFERAPVVCLCESSPMHVVQKEMVQHCDHAQLFGAAVKYQNTLTAAEAAASVQEAVFQATDGRPGPALLNLPSDMGLAECGDPLIVKSAPVASPPDNVPNLSAAREFIQNASRPVVIAGTDVVRAGSCQRAANLGREHRGGSAGQHGCAWCLPRIPSSLGGSPYRQLRSQHHRNRNHEPSGRCSPNRGRLNDDACSVER